MVIRAKCSPVPQHGTVMVELMVAIALLTVALLPLAYSFVTEKRHAQFLYQRAIAMEIVDGEIEVLAASEWRAFAPGTHDYLVHAGAATNLPPGRLQLTLDPGKVRLEWRPTDRQRGGVVLREVDVK
jgi:hypothetical protein